jgi:hypothetical protein
MAVARLLDEYIRFPLPELPLLGLRDSHRPQLPVKKMADIRIDWSFTSSYCDRASPFSNLGDPFDNPPV